MFQTEVDGYQKLCDTNKNVTNMGMIIKGVYSIYLPHGSQKSGSSPIPGML
jgi:hypothetical protein